MPLIGWRLPRVIHQFVAVFDVLPPPPPDFLCGCRACARLVALPLSLVELALICPSGVEWMCVRLADLVSRRHDPSFVVPERFHFLCRFRFFLCPCGDKTDLSSLFAVFSPMFFHRAPRFTEKTKALLRASTLQCVCSLRANGWCRVVMRFCRKCGRRRKGGGGVLRFCHRRCQIPLYVSQFISHTLRAWNTQDRLSLPG